MLQPQKKATWIIQSSTEFWSQGFMNFTEFTHFLCICAFTNTNETQHSTMGLTIKLIIIKKKKKTKKNAHLEISPFIVFNRIRSYIAGWYCSHIPWAVFNPKRVLSRDSFIESRKVSGVELRPKMPHHNQQSSMIMGCLKQNCKWDKFQFLLNNVVYLSVIWVRHIWLGSWRWQNRTNSGSHEEISFSFL